MFSFVAMLTPEPTTVIPPKSERTEEHERLLRDSRREANWKRWGAYTGLTNVLIYFLNCAVLKHLIALKISNPTYFTFLHRLQVLTCLIDNGQP